MKTVSITYEYQNQHSFPLSLHLSVPNTKLFGSQIEISEQSHKPQFTLPPDLHGNQFSYYFLPPGEKLTFTYQYEAKRERNPSLSMKEKDWYLRDTCLTPVTATIQAQAQEITQKARTDRERAYALFDFMTKQYRFDLLHEVEQDDSYESLANGSLYLLREQAGDSRDFACLYASFCRSLGIPCRVIFGAFVIPQYKEHVWNEIYLEAEGWIPVDPCMGRLQRKQWWLSFLSDCKTLYYKRYFGKLEETRPIFAIDPDLGRYPTINLETYRPQDRVFLTSPFSWGKVTYDHIPYFPPVISEEMETTHTSHRPWERMLEQYFESGNFTARLEGKPFPGEWLISFPKWKLTLYQFKDFLFLLMLFVTLPILLAKILVFQNDLPFALELIRHTVHFGVSFCFLLLRIRWVFFGPMGFISLSHLIFLYLEQI